MLMQICKNGEVDSVRQPSSCPICCDLCRRGCTLNLARACRNQKERKASNEVMKLRAEVLCETTCVVHLQPMPSKATLVYNQYHYPALSPSSCPSFLQPCPSLAISFRP